MYCLVQLTSAKLGTQAHTIRIFPCLFFFYSVCPTCCCGTMDEIEIMAVMCQLLISEMLF